MRSFALSLMFLVAVPYHAATAPQQKPIAWVGAGLKIYYDRTGRTYLHVQHVHAGGPAARAGMQPGDLFSSINNQPVAFRDYLEIAEFLGDRKPGDRLVFRGIRDGRPITILVVLTTMPDSIRPAWERSVATARQLREAERRHARP